jgi:ABC-2 type transport system permease protein
MRLWAHEARLLLRARLPVLALALLAALTIAALVAGMHEVARQRARIAAIPAAQAEDIAAVADYVDRSRDAGSAAYYSFHPTWDAPSPLAFAALGMRDVAPHILRVRALGLEAQIYDGDVFNPELALPGRFDFAFVLVFLAPLFALVLLHDLTSSEREAGRLPTLEALPGGGRRLFRRRVALRFALLLAAVGLPFGVGAAIAGVPIGTALAVLALAAGYLLVWTALALLVARRRWSSVANAATLAACWIVLVLVLPTLAHVLINRAVPVNEGAEIALAQREMVNRAWDIPREETMRRFYARHPQWADSPPLTAAFHYKWYFAFHQVGDESVADRVRSYRAGLERRASLAATIGWVLPSVGVQALLTRMAETDLVAQLAYQDRIRAYHARLRAFYYGYLFRDRPFGRADFARAPRFDDRAR